MNLQQHPAPAAATVPASSKHPRGNVPSVIKMTLACALTARLCQKRWIGIDEVMAIQESIGIHLCRRSTQRIISTLIKDGTLVLHPRQRNQKSPANLTFGINPAHPYMGILFKIAYPDRLVD